MVFRTKLKKEKVELLDTLMYMTILLTEILVISRQYDKEVMSIGRSFLDKLVTAREPVHFHTTSNTRNVN